MFQQSAAAEEGLPGKYQGENKVQSANLRKTSGPCIFSLGRQYRIHKLFTIYHRNQMMAFAEQLVQQSGRAGAPPQGVSTRTRVERQSTLELMSERS
jgi:hypothetical protein